jgi:glycerol 3-phosphatase-2
LRESGKPLAYATNNASRRSSQVAELLAGMGVAATPEEVITSAAAAAAVLAERLATQAPVLVVGAEALRAEVRAVGLVPVSRADESPVAVVQGYGPQVGWADLAEAAVAVRAGAAWVVTNTDRTLPSPRGPLPGNGSLVAALRTALDREPDIVVGKPQPGLFNTAAARVGASRPLVVGDRLDTDIEGACRAGMDSLLVLTGVSTPTDLFAAPPSARPTYVARDLGGLFGPGAAVRLPDVTGRADDDGVGEEVGSVDGAGAGDIVRAGGWRLTGDGGELRLTGDGRPLDALRALCTAAWSGRSVDGVRPEGDSARSALRDLGLAGDCVD